MKYELFDFQKDAVSEILKKMASMQRSYDNDGSLSAVALVAPTGAGKTVISAAVIEGLFYGNDTFAGDDRAVILWLSDSPSLNAQTMKRFDDATDILNGATTMESVGPDFAKNHSELESGHVYFLNRQLLGTGKTLNKEIEGNRTFYDVLNNTIEDDNIHLYLFIDEAHRGIGYGADAGTSDSRNKTIYSIIIDGQEGISKPMPCVVGISATPERFNNAMNGRKDRDVKAAVNVPVSEVRTSGLIKDTIELRTPKETADTKHQDLTQACKRLAESSRKWKDYCTSNNVLPVVIPLMVVQVEDKVSTETLAELCHQIHKILPWLDISDCFANVFGEHKDITTPDGKIPYVKPEEVAKRTEIRVLFAKDAVSTGWDCPRAEVIYSRRKRNDPTYIAQLIGRMIRTPLARRIETYEELNSVACYLPEFDAVTVDAVVAKLKEDNVPIEEKNIIKNPAKVGFFGDNKKKIEEKLAKKQAEKTVTTETSTNYFTMGEGKTGSSTTHVLHDGSSFEKPSVYNGSQSQDNLPGNTSSNQTVEDEFPVVTDEDFEYDENVQESEEELKKALDRVPKADSDAIKKSFESIITRQVRHDKTNHFLDLWDCIDVIMSDIDTSSNLGNEIQEEFYNNVEGEIAKHPAEFKRTLADIRNTTISVKRVDPLTGEVFEDRDDIVENDETRLLAYYKDAEAIFAGASDLIKYYINKRRKENLDSDKQVISRISAVSKTYEIVQGLEQWAEKKTNELLSLYGPQRFAVSEDNKAKWDRIEGNTKPYIERTLNVQSSITRQNMDYEKYPKHIISDENGWAYLNLNDLEKKVVKTELSKSLNVAWYRNQSRNLNASLSIPYLLNDEYENMYPDFIFFQKLNDGRIIRTIVDPHGDWLGDSVAKLKGYVEYLNDHPDMFGSVLAVADEKDGKCRYLDLMTKSVQDKIKTFTGSSAKDLFNCDLSKEYTVVTE